MASHAWTVKSLAVPWALCPPWTGEPCHHDHWASSRKRGCASRFHYALTLSGPLDETNDQRQPIQGLKSVQALGLALLRASLTSTEAYPKPLRGWPSHRPMANFWKPLVKWWSMSESPFPNPEGELHDSHIAGTMCLCLSSFHFPSVGAVRCKPPLLIYWHYWFTKLA